MSRVYTDTIEPRKSTQDITLGTSGETISVGANSINVNTVADKGGNTLWTSDGSGNLSSVNSGLKGALVLLDTNTFTGASSSAFTTLIDSTYGVYKFMYNAINPATDGVNFVLEGSIDGGSTWGILKTSTYYLTYNYLTGDTTDLTYRTEWDRSNETTSLILMHGLGNGADECGVGEVTVYTPSNTTYNKIFNSVTQNYDTYSGATPDTGSSSGQTFVGGYWSTTSAINGIRFSMSSGNMDGEIKMYGLL